MLKLPGKPCSDYFYGTGAFNKALKALRMEYTPTKKVYLAAKTALDARVRDRLKGSGARSSEVYSHVFDDQRSGGRIVQYAFRNGWSFTVEPGRKCAVFATYDGNQDRYGANRDWTWQKVPLNKVEECIDQLRGLPDTAAQTQEKKRRDAAKRRKKNRKLVFHDYVGKPAVTKVGQARMPGCVLEATVEGFRTVSDGCRLGEEVDKPGNAAWPLVRLRVWRPEVSRPDLTGNMAVLYGEDHQYAVVKTYGLVQLVDPREDGLTKADGEIIQRAVSTYLQRLFK